MMDGQEALDRLREAEDVLQICYWYQGEGFGDQFTPAGVIPFLKGDVEGVAGTFDRLVAAGELARDGNCFVFTEAGKKKAGRMFFETFTEFQQASHGECNAGCCDGDDECDDPSHDHSHHHHHVLG